MKTSARLISIIVIMFISSAMLAQTSWNYISPKPGSKFINPENAIAFRHGDVLDLNSIRSEAISVISSSRGELSGSFILSNDLRTLIFYPDQDFVLKEKVHVSLKKGIRTVSGLELEGVEFNFSVKEVDNMQMLIDFYEKQYLEEQESLQNNTAEDKMDALYTNENRDAQEYPARFPVPLVTEYDNPAPGYVFGGPRPSGAAPYDPY